MAKRIRTQAIGDLQEVTSLDDENMFLTSLNRKSSRVSVSTMRAALLTSSASDGSDVENTTDVFTTDTHFRVESLTFKSDGTTSELGIYNECAVNVHAKVKPSADGDHVIKLQIKPSTSDEWFTVCERAVPTSVV